MLVGVTRMSGCTTTEIFKVVFVVVRSGSGGDGRVNGRKGGIRDCVQSRGGTGIYPMRRLIGGRLNAFLGSVEIIQGG